MFEGFEQLAKVCMDTCKEHKHVLHNSVQMFKGELINISSPRQTEYVFCYKINYVQRVQGIH